MAKTIQKTRFFLKFRGFPEVLEGRIFPISLALSRFFPKILGLETLFFINLDFLGSRDPRNFNSKNTILPVQTKIFQISGFGIFQTLILDPRIQFCRSRPIFGFPDPRIQFCRSRQFLDFRIFLDFQIGDPQVQILSVWPNFLDFFFENFWIFLKILENFDFFEKKSRQGKGYRLFFLKNSTKSSKKIAKNRKFVAVP